MGRLAVVTGGGRRCRRSSSSSPPLLDDARSPRPTMTTTSEDRAVALQRLGRRRRSRRCRAVVWSLPCVPPWSGSLAAWTAAGDDCFGFSEVRRDDVWDRARPRSGVPSAMTSPEVERDHPVGDRREQRHVVLDDEQARAESRRGCAAAAGRAPRPRAARCRATARRAAAPSGRWASTHARSTMRRLPVDSSWTNLSRKAPRPEQLDELLDAVVDLRPRSRRPTGRWSAAAIGSRTSTLRSSATAIVSATVSAGKSRPSWNERPEAEPGARVGAELGRWTSPSSAARRPGSAAWNPEIRSKSVVLPAPFGPMMPRISPARDVERRRRRARGCRRSASTTPRDLERGRSPSRRRCADRCAVGGATRGRVAVDVHDRRAVDVELDRRRALEEHRAQHVGPLEQLGGRAVEADLALLHEVRRLGDGQRDVHRLLDEDDRGALRPGARARSRAAGRRSPARGRATARRSSAGAGCDEERHAEREHLLLAAGEVAGRLVAGARARTGNMLEHVARSPSRAARRRRGRASPRAGGSRRRSATGTRPGRRAPCTTPRPAISCGRRVGDVAAVEHDRAAVGRARRRRWPSAASTCRRRWCRAARRSRPRRPRSRRRTAPARCRSCTSTLRTSSSLTSPCAPLVAHLGLRGGRRSTPG